jgi:hypothetical protein
MTGKAWLVEFSPVMADESSFVDVLTRTGVAGHSLPDTDSQALASFGEPCRVMVWQSRRDVSCYVQPSCVRSRLGEPDMGVLTTLVGSRRTLAVASWQAQAS